MESMVNRRAGSGTSTAAMREEAAGVILHWQLGRGEWMERSAYYQEATLC